MSSQIINKKIIQANIEVTHQEKIKILRSTVFDKNIFQLVFKARAGKSLQRLEFTQKNLISIINSIGLEEPWHMLMVLRSIKNQNNR
jgi:hypothetical protein